MKTAYNLPLKVTFGTLRALGTLALCYTVNVRNSKGEPMYYFEIAMLVLAVILLVVGYRKNSRNLLLVGAVALYLSAGAEDFVEGWNEGWKEGASPEEREATEEPTN